jgi:hypothetical protein
MAEPKIQYEYGRTPEDTTGGLISVFDLMKGPLADAFTSERREVITPPETKYAEADGRYYPNYTPGVYGPVESGLEYMPVVQGAKSAYNFLGDFISSGKTRKETADALATGIGTLIEDQKRAGINLGMGGGYQFYDPEQKRVISYDPLLVPTTAAVAGAAFPVKGPGAVLGMFAGRSANTADLDALKVAQKMETKGNSRDEIWDQTGWFRFNDREGNPMGEWKFEIPDDLSSAVTDPSALKPYLTETGRVKKGSGRTGYGPEIDKLLVHDELYKAYPGKTLEPVINSLENITQQRAALKAELVTLKKRGLGKEELEAETKRLEALDGDLIRKLIDSIPTSAAPGGPAKTVREQYPLLDRPIGETVMESTTTGGRNLHGYYIPEKNTMAVRRDIGNTEQERMDAFGSTALHELQHAIQNREGFETGGMRQEFGRGFKNRPIDPKTGKQLTPWQTYRSLVGETEARLVQDRRNLDLGQRRSIPPYSQLDESRMYTRKDLGVDRGDSFSSNNAPIPKTPESRELNPDFEDLGGDITQTPRFKEWSGSSNKLRDKDGSVLTLYHDTTADFKEFIPGGPNLKKFSENDPEGLDFDYSGRAVWLSPDRENIPAAHRVGGYNGVFKDGANTMPVYATVKTPLVLDTPEMMDFARERYGDLFPLMVSDEARAKLIQDGYDGVFLHREPSPSSEVGGELSEVLVLNSNQIKSVFNEGGFDPASADIRKASGGFVTKPLYNDARIGGMI